MKKEKPQRKIKNYHKLKGANMDIDLISNKNKINWKQNGCPWSKKEKRKEYKCAVKNISLCRYFKGVEYPDIVICSYFDKKNE
jgi:hypothetical protein